EKKDFRDLLRADKKTSEHFSSSELDELFDYGYYTRYVDETFARLGLIKNLARKKAKSNS
ncbi:MAG: adenylosuccinate lyase, partial [Chloroflexota bacterium]|nr:adenylosuccinate lyase [Chloroflexota bacterium]